MADAQGGSAHENLLPASGRFVVLEHDHPMLHWDFLLEAGGVLRSWRLPAPPQPGTWSAERLPDHRTLYLDYEGPVSGGRGKVVRRDRGTFTSEPSGSDRWRVRLRGESFCGTAWLTTNRSGEWTIRFEDGEA
jgi:hypothetical protein